MHGVASWLNTGGEVIGNPVKLAALEACGSGDSAPSLTEGDGCPPREIPFGRGAMACEVPARELREGFVALKPSRRGNPLVEQRERGLLAIGRPEDDDAGEAEVPEKVVRALARGRDSVCFENGEQVAAL